MSDHDPRERVEYNPGERVPAKSDEQIVREYLEGVSGKDLSVLDRLTGDERLIQADAFLRSAFPDYRLDIDGISSAEGKIAVHFTLRGTHGGTFYGVDATGTAVSAPGVASFRVEAGRIVDAAIDTDDEEILRQLGHPEAYRKGETRAA